jgi:chitinase
VNLSTSNGTAHAPADYTAVTNKLVTLAAGKTSQTVTVPLINDTLDEDNETFNVTLSAPQNATIDPVGGTAIVTVNDNDAMPTIGIDDWQGVESNVTYQTAFGIYLSAPSGRDVKVTVKTVNGSAAAPIDFTAKTAVVTIPAGQTTALFSVSIKGDTVVEPDETFTVTLSTLVNASAGDLSAVGKLVNDD